MNPKTESRIPLQFVEAMRDNADAALAGWLKENAPPAVGELAACLNALTCYLEMCRVEPTRTGTAFETFGLADVLADTVAAIGQAGGEFYGPGGAVYAAPEPEALSFLPTSNTEHLALALEAEE